MVFFKVENNATPTHLYVVFSPCVWHCLFSTVFGNGIMEIPDGIVEWLWLRWVAEVPVGGGGPRWVAVALLWQLMCPPPTEFGCGSAHRSWLGLFSFERLSFPVDVQQSRGPHPLCLLLRSWLWSGAVGVSVGHQAHPQVTCLCLWPPPFPQTLTVRAAVICWGCSQVVPARRRVSEVWLTGISARWRGGSPPGTVGPQGTHGDGQRRLSIQRGCGGEATRLSVVAQCSGLAGGADVGAGQEALVWT